MAVLKNKGLVHVLGSVDLKKGSGDFLYVLPTIAVPTISEDTTAGRAAPPDDKSAFELVVEGADGSELRRLRPRILVPTDEDDPQSGLIDEIIPNIEGMRRLVLLHNGSMVATFEAGTPPEPDLERAAGKPSLSLGMAPPGRPEKRPMSLDTPVVPEPGISYTVQVRPEGEDVWQTIAVGRETPKVTLDRNQFPGAVRATVRVLRSTGFEDTIIVEENVSLADSDRGWGN
ncbi:hypothetical protein [Sinorhizobium medicae]|uniref:hypothetical protein n=1 Tax=Sinorhizobium medicae TaxID=110321 RepID=UPI000FD88408|nr:hypothetical protein [Sinorhizobium medicae]RVJ72537.1 hypothetical protein CN168_26715 [Sinorhizobium medicae]